MTLFAGIPFATQTVAVQRAPLIADHGSQVRDWTSPATHTIGGCSVQPGGGTEDQLNRDSVTTVWSVFAPLGADVLDTDRVVVGGVAYEVDGPVRPWETGILDHLEISLKAVAG